MSCLVWCLFKPLTRFLSMLLIFKVSLYILGSSSLSDSIVQVFLPLVFIWLSLSFAEERLCFNEAGVYQLSLTWTVLWVLYLKSSPNLFLHVAQFSHHRPYHINHICLNFLVWSFQNPYHIRFWCLPYRFFRWFFLAFYLLCNFLLKARHDVIENRSWSK